MGSLSPVGNSFGLPDYRALKPLKAPGEELGLMDAARSSNGWSPNLTNGWNEAFEAKDVSAAPLKPELGSAAGSASAPLRSLASSSSAPLLSLGSPSPSRPGSRGVGMPSPEKTNSKGWTPKDPAKKKMDAAEMARRSDAFWASVEADIGTG